MLHTCIGEKRRRLDGGEEKRSSISEARLNFSKSSFWTVADLHQVVPFSIDGGGEIGDEGGGGGGGG